MAEPPILKANHILAVRSTGAKIPPPSHLSAHSKRFWQQISASWDLESHHLRILELACGALDRGEEARLAITRDGAYQPARDGFKMHPAISVERESSRTALRALRELGFDVSDQAPSQRNRKAS